MTKLEKVYLQNARIIAILELRKVETLMGHSGASRVLPQLRDRAERLLCKIQLGG